MTDQERWQRDLEEIEFFLLLLFVFAWSAFWWCAGHIS
jgi:hypothetical protein